MPYHSFLFAVGYTSGLAAGVSLLMFSGIVIIAIIIFMVAWHNKKHRVKTKQEQAEVNTIYVQLSSVFTYCNSYCRM